jgi:hypothetical protein
MLKWVIVDLGQQGHCPVFEVVDLSHEELAAPRLSTFVRKETATEIVGIEDA